MRALIPGPGEPAVVVAEIGVNHDGDVAKGRELVHAAAEAGADAVKLQSFTPEALAAPDTPLVAYQERGGIGSSHLDMLRALALDLDDQAELLTLARTLGLGAISTPYDVAAARALGELGVDAVKTASADVVDLPLQEAVASLGLPTMLATGMATLGEIEAALVPHRDASTVLLHCVSAYPAPDTSLHLRALPTLAAAFGRPVGFSDHSVDPAAATVALALGAVVFERHLTLDRSAEGPDHRASSEPEELAAYVAAIRRAELQLGSSVVGPQPVEAEMAAVSRKSLVLARDVPAGRVLGRDDLTTRRPGLGISPLLVDEVVGRPTRRDLAAGHRLGWGDLA